VPVEITMPKLGLTMETGTIARWLKASGESIAEGDPVVEVASDKINFQVDSPASGTMATLLGQEGEEFACGAVIGTIALPGEAARDPAAPRAFAAVGNGVAVAAPVAVGNGVAVAGAPAVTAPAASLGAVSVRDGGRFIASPAARRLARKLGFPITEVVGTGPRGRVTLSDVHGFRGIAERAAERPPERAPASSPPALPANLAPSRRAIYRKMTEIGLLPLATVETIVRVDAVKALIERRRDFGWTAYAVYACARLLRQDAELRIDARTGKPFEALDIGVAADTPRGLIVPVVRQAEVRSLAEIHAEIIRLATLARDGTIAAQDVGGACFSVSNVGPQRVERVAPLVDTPQTAILGIGAATERPAVVGGAVVAAWMLTCVLTFDHRFVDGAPAARFLAKLAQAFGDPEMLL
jgi:pyruvate dehydrogenase E2 component (dihydrolipoamide acetyltransferase)